MCLSCHLSSVSCSCRRRCLPLVLPPPQCHRHYPAWPSACRRCRLSTGHPCRPLPSRPLLNTTHFFGLCHHCCHCHCRLPCCPHFPWTHFSIPKGEYDDFKHVVVVQLTTQKFCEQCNDPRSNSDPRMYILQYRMHFANACSPIYSLHTVSNSSVGPSPPPHRSHSCSRYAVRSRFLRCKRLATQQCHEIYCTHLCVCRGP